MKQTVNATQIYYAVLRGKANQQLFEEEIQKMKLLTTASGVRDDMDVRILAYCVLDNEMHLMIKSEDEQLVHAFLDKIARRYEETCIPDDSLRIDYLSEKNVFPNVNSSVHERGFVYRTNKKAAHFRKNMVKNVKDLKSALRYCLKLHMMPVVQGIVAQPEDYWWCSYLDYQGRQWLPLADPSDILAQFSENSNQAMRLIRNRHQKALAKISPIKENEWEAKL